MKGRLSEINTRAVSRRQDELIGKFMMAADDVISTREQVLEYTYIPTGIERECDRCMVAPHKHIVFYIIRV